MSIAYPPELADFVKHEIDCGACHSEDELIVNALLAYREMKLRHEELRGRVEKSLNQADHGEAAAWDIDAIIAEAHSRQARR
jgi:Arc/MetJ-type ribon-helix-helix transcriptional regulator